MRKATRDEFISNGLATTHMPTGTRYSTYRYEDPRDVRIATKSLGHEFNESGEEYDMAQVEAVALEILKEARAAEARR